MVQEFKIELGQGSFLPDESVGAIIIYSSSSPAIKFMGMWEKAQEVNEWTNESLARVGRGVSVVYKQERKSDLALEREQMNFKRNGYKMSWGHYSDMWVADPRQ